MKSSKKKSSSTKTSTKAYRVAGIIRQDTGVGWYRIMQPLMALGRMGVDYRTNRFTGQNEIATIGSTGSQVYLKDKTLMEICTKGTDIMWSTIIIDHEEILKMLDLRMWSGAKWIVDIDDDMYNVSSDNPAKQDSERLIQNIEMCLKLADGVTVSVPRLKEVYKHLNPNIFVNPNGQNFPEWSLLQTKKGTTKSLRIGWRGASGHSADASIVEPALVALKKQYDLTFVTSGVKPHYSDEHHVWVGAIEFPKSLAKLNLDIALVPLIDKAYNHAKSNIAVQEFSMLKIPVVASPVENQKNMPVLYASNNFDWYEQLEKLIKDPELRQKQAENQYNFIKEHYNVDKLAKPLLEWMQSLPRKELKPE